MNRAVMLGGAIVVAIAAVYFFAGGREKDDKGVTCSLTTAGAAALAGGLFRNESAKTIAAAVGASGGGAGCSKVVDRLVAGQSAKVKLQTQNDSVTQTVTRDELTTPATPPAERTPTILDCFRWQTAWIRQLCFDGQIGPPQ